MDKTHKVYILINRVETKLPMINSDGPKWVMIDQLD